MNVNPHLQYLLQQQQQQQAGNPQGGQSLQASQLQQQQQQQRHLQQQRQQLLSQHLQQNQPQQPQQPHGQTTNPLLAALNGGINGQNNSGLGTPGNGSANLNFNQNVNPLLQLQLQQLQQQQQQQPVPQQSVPQQPQQQPVPQQRIFLNQNIQQQPHTLQQQQAPLIKEVWNFNLEHEFNSMRSFINDKTANIFISIHQEIPGIVARPVGTFKSSADYHFQTLRSNSDLLNLIQLSMCAVKVRNNEISGSVIWQFNFLYDLTKEMFNEEHLSMLTQTSQINFASHMSQGIPHFAFAELMIESGLLLDPSINWLSYHSGYDLGFLISLLTNNILPGDEREFFWWCSKYFPNFYDLKHVGNQLLSNGTGKVSTNGLNSNNNEFGGVLNANSANGPGSDLGKNLTSNNKPSVEYLAEELHLLPISPAIRQYFTSSSLGQFSNHQHQQMTSTLHAYLLMECFKELFRQTNFDLTVLEKFKGYLWGLGDAYVQIQESGSASDKQDTAAPSAQQW
ncbi:CIC11C00000004614 [Sungouiella intermedia]|uniref:CIC11C00000004614 n=1 Tax=Sungouiella intermedia TaxID=45354 RepID=A0A1L0DPG4_9ASCO|nr:CIC11C00000004614 [[Candida] intermedia]